MSQVLKTDWSKIADGTATGIEVYNGSIFSVKDGYFLDMQSKVWVTDESPEKNTIIAVRPNPPLTDEQKQAIEDYCEWAGRHSYGERHPKTYFKALEDEQ